jgi:4-diphosphocytidyl-2-methyl-D-erithritol synthase
MKRFAAIIVAAGSGTRLGAPKPKQFLMLPHGRTMLEQSIYMFQQHKSIEQIVVVRPDGEALPLPKDIIQVSGGKSRAASVARGMNALKRRRT